MQNLNFLETELLDILFRGKNKYYGAYALRKYYPQRLKKAVLAMTLGIFSLFMLYFAWPVQSVPPVIVCPFPDIPPLQIINIDLPPGIQADAGKVIEANPDIPTVVVKRTKVKPPIEKPKKEILKSPIIPGVVEGGIGDAFPKGGGTGDALEGSGPSGKGAQKAVVIPPKPDPNEIIIAAQKMPEFPGGEKALLEYLQNNINYPILAKRANVTGTVHIEFVVNKKGRISDIKVLKGLGYGCDKETIRVIKSMPTWIPGENQGHKVNVSYNIPVTFEMDEF